MKRRGVGIIGILFLCASIVSCGKAMEPEGIKENEQTETQIEDTDDILSSIKDKATLDTAGQNTLVNKAKSSEQDTIDNTTLGSEQNVIGNTSAGSELNTIGSATDDSEQDTVSGTATSIFKIEATGEGEEVTDNDSVLTMDILSMKYDLAQIRDSLREYPSGTAINTAGAEGRDLESLFYSEEISEEIKNRINGKSYREECDTPYEELRYLRVLYKGFDGKTYIGELIVNKAITQDIIEIFRELYVIDYPIERIFLVDDFGADDSQSMEANNTSAFNYRLVAGTTRRSKHSYGTAIDINPLYNPYITEHDGNTTVLPENATEYVDRTKDLEYYIRKGDPCYEAFIKRGFTWGGEWKNSKDYQHFEKALEK
ncbi:MAG TPA: M15 family metallopeptidase [Mobilitalea sp.]|nr:M15 family metallopeptidase [Mobilitalea sp.]